MPRIHLPYPGNPQTPCQNAPATAPVSVTCHSPKEPSANPCGSSHLPQSRPRGGRGVPPHPGERIRMSNLVSSHRPAFHRANPDNSLETHEQTFRRNPPLSPHPIRRRSLPHPSRRPLLGQKRRLVHPQG